MNNFTLPGTRLLHPCMQRFVEGQRWGALRPIQARAIETILTTQMDAVISAPTSGGKTEAAFLPTISAALNSQAPGFRILYIAPLKALINDQFNRLSLMCKGCALPVQKWHGDVDDAKKRALRQRPSGILLITPESLESSLVNFGHLTSRLFGSTMFVVIDELHSFFENERGIHVRSLLARIIQETGHQPRMVGLSATLADVSVARRFLNMDQPGNVALIEDSTPRSRDIEVRTVHEPVDPLSEGDALSQIAFEINREFSRSTNLVFANNRKTVELLGSLLQQNEHAEEGGYLLHHGSLSRQTRLSTESALKNAESATAIATSTLELGIDIGAVQAVAQIDPPHSVSALVQRVGRSGRRGTPSTLRLYVRCPAPSTQASNEELLAAELLQGIALVQLMEQGWLEKPNFDRPHLSTLVHQTLSLLKQHGHRCGGQMHQVLCQRGPFRGVSVSDYKDLLQALNARDLIRTESDGMSVLTMTGEKLTSNPDFYAAFASPIEFTIRHAAEQIGKLPITFGIKNGDTVMLNARHWQIQRIDGRTKTIWVGPVIAAKPPVFIGRGGDVDARVHQVMRSILCGRDVPEWLDGESVEVLGRARDAAEQFGLHQTDLLVTQQSLEWYPWAGSRALETLRLWGSAEGVEVATLHSYRYAWAKRAKEAGYPERWAQIALGHGSKAMARHYSKNAEVVLPSLESWKADPNKVVVVQFKENIQAVAAQT